jgi:predicted RNA binding protein YcfA (HicA-like mRNA interferase family)
VAKLPVCSGAETIRAFERAGWRRDRQKGSHVSLTKAAAKVVLTVPLHSELAPGTLRKLIRLSGLSVEEFTDALNH